LRPRRVVTAICHGRTDEARRRRRKFEILMNAAFLALLSGRLASQEQLSSSHRATAFAVGVGIVLLGVYLQWRLPEYAATAEERVKDRQLTEEQARGRIRVFRVIGPTVIIGGLALLVVVFLT
jgi:hypothetical protein